MIPKALRMQVRGWLAEAVAAGARYTRACAVIGLSARCVQRWRSDDIDARSTRVQTPVNALSTEEVATILATVNAPEYAHLPPTQIVPMLADQHVYIGSESSIYRILRREKQLSHRRAERVAQPRSRPSPLMAFAPNQVATWDITYLPSDVRGRYFYLYAVLDLFSRKVVAWQVFDCESQMHASALMRDYAERERIAPDQLTLHADNGAVMKGSTLYATLQALHIAPSHSRPSVSDDNPFIESLFKTIKYRPRHPLKAFTSLDEARRFADLLMAWYNTEHRHSQIRYVTPQERHEGRDVAILAQRQQVYANARRRHPKRWTADTRNWSRIEQVSLNPHRVEQMQTKNQKGQ
jgi:putative transposase